MAQDRREDKLFAAQMQEVSDFTFDTATAKVFDDMVERSVPLYTELQRMMAELSIQFLQHGSVMYDLGCATGSTMKAVAQSCTDTSVRFIGIDNSEAMLQKAGDNLRSAGVMDKCELRIADLTGSIDLSDASVVIMAWTLQFVRPFNRDQIISHIHRNLRPGGCLIITEKAVLEDPALNRLYINMYHDYKRRRGYSELEISQKREALENILIPYRVEENIELMKRNGFTTADVFFRWYNWSGLIAVKP